MLDGEQKKGGIFQTLRGRNPGFFRTVQRVVSEWVSDHCLCLIMAEKNVKRKGLRRSASFNFFTVPSPIRKLMRAEVSKKRVNGNNKVEIIGSLADLSGGDGGNNNNGVLNIEDIRVWKEKIGEFGFKATNPEALTTNLSWLVGGGSRHIDVYETPSQPPSHLNVRDADQQQQQQQQQQRSYALSRSKSVCDLTYVNLMGDEKPSMDTMSEYNNSNSNSMTTADKSTSTTLSGISLQRRRNKTILGSFPLLHKFSRSLNSLSYGDNNDNDAGLSGVPGMMCPEFSPDDDR